jgi:hypothetical protein
MDRTDIISNGHRNDREREVLREDNVQPVLELIVDKRKRARFLSGGGRREKKEQEDIGQSHEPAPRPTPSEMHTTPL